MDQEGRVDYRMLVRRLRAALLVSKGLQLEVYRQIPDSGRLPPCVFTDELRSAIRNAGLGTLQVLRNALWVLGSEEEEFLAHDVPRLLAETDRKLLDLELEEVRLDRALRGEAASVEGEDRGDYGCRGGGA